MSTVDREALRAKLTPLVAQLYGPRADEVLDGLLDLAERWAPQLDRTERVRPDEGTAYLIAYGDAFRRPGEAPLHTLASVLREHVRDAVSDVHLLPIYPWTSDDGFGVVDHRQVNPELGSWDDIADLRADHALALDFVANHVSSSSPWFHGWLARDPAFDGYFLEPGASFDVSHVVRPRTTPLVHEYVRPDGSAARAWTTFGPDQVDIDPSTPAVLLDLTDVLLGYLAHGATTVRLDAIGYLWKESGSTCIHLPQTHAIIRIWRVLVDALAPGTLLLTETNVPHADNITYFGDGSNEAHMVYQFALPPLVLHAFVTGQATALAAWASGIGPVSPTATWFNFLASHDGIGIRPTEGLLTDDDRTLLVERTLARGGRVSMARRPDGSEGVYELNTNYLDALVDPENPRSGCRRGGPRAGRARDTPVAGRGARDLLPLAARVGPGPRGDGGERHRTPHQPRGSRRRSAGRRARVLAPSIGSAGGPSASLGGEALASGLLPLRRSVGRPAG